MTGGQYYSADSAAELRTLFQDLHHMIAMSNETTEISVFFVAIGALMILLAAIRSLLQHPTP